MWYYQLSVNSLRPFLCELAVCTVTFQTGSGPKELASRQRGLAVKKETFWPSRVRFLCVLPHTSCLVRNGFIADAKNMKVARDNMPWKNQDSLIKQEQLGQYMLIYAVFFQVPPGVPAGWSIFQLEKSFPAGRWNQHYTQQVMMSRTNTCENFYFMLRFTVSNPAQTRCVYWFHNEKGRMVVMGDK